MLNTMHSIEAFLAHAIKLEQDAAVLFEELADVMESANNGELESFFRQMAQFARLHLADAKALAKGMELPDYKPDCFVWGEKPSPECAPLSLAQATTIKERALALALEGERGARDFYKSVAASTPDADIRALALEFAEEESEHVAELERWIGRGISISKGAA